MEDGLTKNEDEFLEVVTGMVKLMPDKQRKQTCKGLRYVIKRNIKWVKEAVEEENWSRVGEAITRLKYAKEIRDNICKP